MTSDDLIIQLKDFISNQKRSINLYGTINKSKYLHYSITIYAFSYGECNYYIEIKVPRRTLRINILSDNSIVLKYQSVWIEKSSFIKLKDKSLTRLLDGLLTLFLRDKLENA